MLGGNWGLLFLNWFFVFLLWRLAWNADHSRSRALRGNAYKLALVFKINSRCKYRASGGSLFFACTKKSNQKKVHPAFGFCCAKLPSLRHNFGGRREGPSMALHSSIVHPAQLPPKIAPPLSQKKGSTSAPNTVTLVDRLKSKFSFPRSAWERIPCADSDLPFYFHPARGHIEHHCML